MPPTVTVPPRDLRTVDNSARMSGREQEAAVSDYSAGERGTPNGPAPYQPRVEEPRPPASGTTTADRPAAAQPTSVQPTAVQPTTVQPTAAQPAAAAPAAQPVPAAAAPPRELKGRIHIADEVVEKVAGLAAMEVPGVADLGGDFARALESVRERIGIGNKRGDQGVKAEVSGHQVAISVTIMVEFGHVVLEVARQVQANVARQTQRMLGLAVVEVNVTVDDVRTPRPQRDDRPAAGEEPVPAQA
jgi:uncharacterized alkaline shock family protein YloU